MQQEKYLFAAHKAVYAAVESLDEQFSAEKTTADKLLAENNQKEGLDDAKLELGLPELPENPKHALHDEYVNPLQNLNDSKADPPDYNTSYGASL